MAELREFLDFWMQNSVHAAEEYKSSGAMQNVDELSRRCVEMAHGEGLSKADLEAEVGDLGSYIRETLKLVNTTENNRRNRHQPK